ncbi:MAG: hypothetical protein ABW187_06725 [Dokdonella sp.]
MKLLPCVAVTALLLFRQAHADDACSAFKWDMKHEHTLFMHEGHTATVGKDDKSAPMLDMDRLYLITLAPQKTVKFAAPPSKKAPAASGSAGLVHFRIAKAGQYRVSADVPLWIDLVADGKAIAPVDFSSAHECTAPRKVVLYDLPASQALTVQLSGSSEAQAHITLTPVPKS